MVDYFPSPKPPEANATTIGSDKMRPLTEPELKTLVEKLATYCGKGISNLIADPAADRHVFRIQVGAPYTSS